MCSEDPLRDLRPLEGRRVGVRRKSPTQIPPKRSGLSLENVFQCTSLVFPCFKYAKAAVDYFLSHVVFLQRDEGTRMLTASGWDIGEKRLPVTGFSRTNDSRVVLPLSVQQLDLPEQQHPTPWFDLHIAVGDDRSGDGFA